MQVVKGCRRAVPEAVTEHDCDRVIDKKSENKYQINQATLYSSLKRLETLKYKVWKKSIIVVGIGQKVDDDAPF
jgi:hypothetical protein